MEAYSCKHSPCIPASSKEEEYVAHYLPRKSASQTESDDQPAAALESDGV